jgi:hypothetical protein
MDEVGRGTTVKDGLAIAFSTVHHLHSINGCRALFATHFHELADMLGYSDNHRGLGKYENVRFFCTDVAETEVKLLFLVRLTLVLTNVGYRTDWSHTPTASSQVSIVIVTVLKWHNWQACPMLR